LFLINNLCHKWTDVTAATKALFQELSISRGGASKQANVIAKCSNLLHETLRQFSPQQMSFSNIANTNATMCACCRFGCGVATSWRSRVSAGLGNLQESIRYFKVFFASVASQGVSSRSTTSQKRSLQALIVTQAQNTRHCDVTVEEWTRNIWRMSAWCQSNARRSRKKAVILSESGTVKNSKLFIHGRELRLAPTVLTASKRRRQDQSHDYVTWRSITQLWICRGYSLLENYTK